MGDQVTLRDKPDVEKIFEQIRAHFARERQAEGVMLALGAEYLLDEERLHQLSATHHMVVLVPVPEKGGLRLSPALLTGIRDLRGLDLQKLLMDNIEKGE
jgi:hypothetical protein